jgi:hypothetical protein
MRLIESSGELRSRLRPVSVVIEAALWITIAGVWNAADAPTLAAQSALLARSVPAAGAPVWSRPPGSLRPPRTASDIAAGRRPTLTFADSARQATLGRAYELALHNLLDVNTVAYDAATYDSTGFLADPPGTFVRAGGGYHQPWTRDASVNTWNAASLLEPAAARNTLWAVVSERPDGSLVVQQDNEWWDQCIWIVSAWNHYLVTGDLAFLADAYGTAVNTLAVRRDADYDATWGLFRGPGFFNDGIAGYPAPPATDSETSSFVLDYRGTATQMTLSTNELYYEAYRRAALMARELGRPAAEAERLSRAADSLKATVNRHFWIPSKGLYGYFIHDGDGVPPGTLDPSQEGAGEAFAVLFHVADSARARSILDKVHEEPWGIPDVWPHFARYDADHPGRHNVVVWPMVQGFWADAAAQAGDAAVFGREVSLLATLATRTGGAGGATPTASAEATGSDEARGDFREIYNARTGAPDGGWQTGHHWASEDDQTWSATAYLRMIFRGLFGMRFTIGGLGVQPLLPAGWGDVTLTGVPYRSMTLDITLRGAGGRIARCTVDGIAKTTCGVPATLRGEHRITVTLTGW